MAVKKFLNENGKQVWPITRADCVYNVAGDDLLSNVVDNEVQARKNADDAIKEEIGVASVEEAEGQEAEHRGGKGSLPGSVGLAPDDRSG